MEIRYLKRDEIDQLKWDSCVHYANNGQVYGYTWYLDNVAEEWDGLVEGDYESVFPLVWNSKIFGIKQLYQPFLSQQLGLFSVNLLSKARLKHFIEAIPTEFKYWNFQLNYHNAIPEDWGYTVSKRSNFELALYDSYEDLSSHYSKNLQRSLKKARKSDLILTGNVKPEKLVELYKTHQGPKIGNLPDEFYHAAHRVIYNALHRGRGFLSGVLNRKGDLLAAGFFLNSHHRITNLLPSSTPEGREVCAMHHLMDMLIRGSAGRKVILDFEGSSIPSIARFYESFGAIDVPFYQIKRNKLPLPLRLVKK